jgi:hypothetical protein
VSLASEQTAVKAWVRALLGFAATDPVVMENEPRPMFKTAIGTLAWVSRAGLGVDEVRYEDSGDIAPASNLVPVVMGPRVRVLQVTVEALAQDPAAPSALALCERAQDRMRRPSSLAALAAANLGLISAQTISINDAKRDQRWNARAVLEVRLNATSFDRDTTGAAPSIESVEISSALQDVDGTQLPAELQFNNEVMP